MVFLLVAFAACENIEYSPFQTKRKGSPRNLTAQNMSLLETKTPKDTLTVVLTGDTQRFYDECGPFVSKVNSIPNIDFVLVSGDISDFGILSEFEWVHDALKELYVPYFTVIGNHDMIANGTAIYERMYGPQDYSFVYNKVKFVFHNTNSREVNFDGTVPNLNWLRETCLKEEGQEHVVAISHVPPLNDDFDNKLAKEYNAIFKQTPGFLVSLHGHMHTTTTRHIFDNEVLYINSSSVQKREFVLIKIADGEMLTEIIPF